jgi:type VI secretion system protein ImpK
MSEYGDSFLLAPFREFYAEIIRLKQMVIVGAWVSPSSGAGAAVAKPDGAQGQTGTWVYFPDVMAEATDDVAQITAHTWTPTADSTSALVKVEGADKSAVVMDYPEPFPSDSYRISTLVWHRLASLFQRQAVTAWRYGGTYGAEFYREAQYVMVALADEIFLHMEWEGQRAWVSNLLESKIFHTHAAGELFFEKMDRLLHEQNPVNRDLAAVYLMALSLGFRGKYYDRNDHGEIARYRHNLFSFICRREPDLDDEKRYVFPEAYYHNVREERQRELSDPRKWFLVLFLVVFVYVAATHALWTELTRDLNTINQSISKIVAELKALPQPSIR